MISPPPLPLTDYVPSPRYSGFIRGVNHYKLRKVNFHDFPLEPQSKLRVIYVICKL